MNRNDENKNYKNYQRTIKYGDVATRKNKLKMIFTGTLIAGIISFPLTYRITSFLSTNTYSKQIRELEQTSTIIQKQDLENKIGKIYFSTSYLEETITNIDEKQMENIKRYKTFINQKETKKVLSKIYSLKSLKDKKGEQAMIYGTIVCLATYLIGWGICIKKGKNYFG